MVRVVWQLIELHVFLYAEEGSVNCPHRRNFSLERFLGLPLMHASVHFLGLLHIVSFLFGMEGPPSRPGAQFLPLEMRDLNLTSGAT